MRVLVTGLQGFTGRHLADALRAAGHTVNGLEIPAAVGDHAPVDLCDAQAVMSAVASLQPQAVIHLAAVAFAAHDDVDAIYRTNIVGTRNLLAALSTMEQKPSRVVLASSAHVYGNIDGNGVAINERMPLNPASDYAVSKAAMEYMAHTWFERLPITITRPFNYTGVGQDIHFLIPKIVDHFRRGERSIELGNLDVWREFMDVRAIAWAYQRLLEIPAIAGTVNLCGGVSHSLREVLAMMADIAGYDIEVTVNPAFVRSNEVRRLEGDPTRLQEHVGSLPSYSLADTLFWMYSAS